MSKAYAETFAKMMNEMTLLTPQCYGCKFYCSGSCGHAENLLIRWDPISARVYKYPSVMTTLLCNGICKYYVRGIRGTEWDATIRTDGEDKAKQDEPSK